MGLIQGPEEIEAERAETDADKEIVYFCFNNQINRITFSNLNYFLTQSKLSLPTS